MKKIVSLLCLSCVLCLQTTAQGKENNLQHRLQTGQQPAAENDEADEAPADKSRQNPKGKKPKVNVDEIMYTITGIGMDFYKPPLLQGGTVTAPWVNFNALLNLIELQLGFGKIEADAAKADPAIFENSYPVGTPGRDVFGTNIGLQFTHPLGASWAGINSRNPRSLLRAGFFLAGGGGMMSLWEGKKDFRGNYFYLDVAPGFRLYNEFLTAEFRLQGMLGMKKNTGYDVYFKKSAIMPMLTLRVNGGFSRLFQNTKRVATATSTNEYIGHDNYYNYYNVKTTYGSTVLNNIGTYFGVGPRVTFTAPANDVFHQASILGGVNAQLRTSKLILGLNAETGSIQHGSSLKKKRTVDPTDVNGLGTLKATNVFADLGLDITSIMMMMLGTARDDGGVTTFTAFSFGYSVGYGFIGNQKFANPLAANAHYDGLALSSGETPTPRTDPRLSKSGLLSGFFMGLEMGNVGFRAQWFRHRNAPLANNLYYTLSYRIGKSKR